MSFGFTFALALAAVFFLLAGQALMGAATGGVALLAYWALGGEE